VVLPQDPFGVDTPEFSDIEYPESRRGLQILLRELAQAGTDAKALTEQASVEDALTAIGTLDELEVRVVLLRLIVDLQQARLGPEAFNAWMLAK
jgi:hypothetical protein